jgi:hypothetical protein
MSPTASWRRSVPAVLKNIRLGNRPVELKASDICRSDSQDLAMIPITAALATVLENDVVTVRPPLWPPPALQAGDPILFAGFPAAGRVGQGNDVDMSGITSLAIIHSVHDDEFVAHLDPDYLERRGDPTSPSYLLDETAVRGLSGGPAFLVDQGDELREL